MLTLLDRDTPPPDQADHEQTIARLRAIAADPGYALEAGRLLCEMRSSMNGTYLPFLRSLRPDLARPDAWAERMITRFQMASPANRDAGTRQHPTPGGPANGPQSPLPGTAESPQPSPGPEHGTSSEPSLDARAARRFAVLRPILDLPTHQRRDAIAAAMTELGMGQSAIYAALKRIEQGGATALNRKARADRGKLRLPADVVAWFKRRRLDPMTRHETIAMSITNTRQQFPGVPIGQHQLRRIESEIPKALQMRQEIWNRTYLPIGTWEVDHVNHTWTFDGSKGDLFVWDRDPAQPPYRPEILAIVDEASQACLYLLYIKGAVSRATLQSCLLNAMLPKGTDWPMCGIPDHLHADNGKVQDSQWLTEVCRTFSTELGLMGDLRHAQVRSPWMDGHVERFFGILHSRFESQISGYCGADNRNKPESYPDLGNPKAWRDLLSLEDLNLASRFWITGDYHCGLRHSRLKMARQDWWTINAPGHVRLVGAADEQWLRDALLQRETRMVSRNTVQIFGRKYWSAELMGYEGVTAQVRYDPADLSYLLVVGQNGEMIRAQRQTPKSVDDPKDLAEHNQQKQQVRTERKALQLAHNIVADAPPEERTAFIDRLTAADAARKAEEPIPFPNRQTVKRREYPEPDLDELVGAEAESTLRSPEGEAEPLIIDGMEV